MNWGSIRNEATALAAGLPPFPEPWNVTEICRRLAERRRRTLLIHAVNLPALPFGLWYDDGKRDHVIHRAGLSDYHRDHVVLHEVCHILAGHNAVNLSTNKSNHESDISQLLSEAARNGRADSQEELAETFASIVLRLANKFSVGSITVFEQRATAVFGTA